MKNLISLALIVVFISCNDSAHESTENLAKENETTEITAVKNDSVRFSIEGMTCEIGCVRTVKSRLSKMNGVLTIDMDFDTARTLDYANVTFDNRLVTTNDMKKEIESIANGIYSVNKSDPIKN